MGQWKPWRSRKKYSNVEQLTSENIKEVIEKSGLDIDKFTKLFALNRILLRLFLGMVLINGIGIWLVIRKEVKGKKTDEHIEDKIAEDSEKIKKEKINSDNM